MAIVRLDKIQAIYNGNLESVVHTANMTNGLFFHLGALKTGEREIHNVVVPTTASITSEELLLHASPELMYDESHYSKQRLENFVVEAGKAGRAYHLTEGDVITMTADLFTGTPVVGEYVVPQNGSMKLAAAADLTGGTRFAAKVIEQTKLGWNNQTAYAIKVIKV